MRLVLEPNVLIAAFATRGYSAEVFDHCRMHHTILISARLLEEFERAARKKLKFQKATVKEMVQFLGKQLAVIQDVPPLKGAVCRDPDDDHVLALAVAGQAEVLITGDSDLLILKKYRGIPILKPSEFWALEQASRSKGPR